MPDRTLEDSIIRIDERTLNIWRTLEKVERHQAAQNGKLDEFCLQVNRNTVWRRVIVSVLGVGFPVLVTVLVLLFMSIK